MVTADILRERGVITPWGEKRGSPSWGAGTHGYDIRLAADKFQIFLPSDGESDPRRFNNGLLEDLPLYPADGDTPAYFLLPSHTYGLGFSVERFKMPQDMMAIAVGKSTYARCGIIVNITPLEPGWEGHLTIEVANVSGVDCRIYVEDAGIAQLLFFDVTPNGGYAGKYQGQGAEVVYAR